MHGSCVFDAGEFVEYLRGSRLAFLISCGIAVVLTLAVSVMLPKSFTAKSAVLVEPPAGNDSRVATAFNPVWLESLRTYESLASSDALFLRGSERLHLADSKRSALKVSRSANTALIEISVTLHDARAAQALAQYIAEQTVELNRVIVAKSAEDSIGALRAQLHAALDRLTRANDARDAFAISNPIEALESELNHGFDFAPARSGSIDAQRREILELLKQKGAQIDLRKSRRAALDDEARAARAAYEDILARLNAALFSPQSRFERLLVVDQGVVPQRPSFPNIPLNVLAALFASLCGTFGYLALRFTYVQPRRQISERVYSLH